MAGKTAILAVKIIADAKDFSKGTDKAISGLDKFKKSASAMTAPAALVGTALVGMGAKFVKAASDFEQNSGAVDAVFKGMSGQVNKLAENSAQKLGLSGNDYKQYASLVGAQLKNAGIPMDQLVGKTDGLINIGADLAAQFGGTVPDAIGAMSSALKGEFDPLEKYGITLNANAVNAEAATLGFQKLNGQYSDQAKKLAIMSLINKQSADAQGANAREANTAAGAQARLGAAFDDISVKLGTALLPILTTVVGILQGVVKWVSENTGAAKALAVGIGLLVAGILILNGVMLVMNVIALVNPWVILAVAVVALVGFIIYLATQTKFFQIAWAAVSKFCAQVWANFTKFISDAWNNAVAFITGLVNRVRANFQSQINIIRAAWNTGFNFIRNIVSGVVNGIIAIVRRIIGAVSVVIANVRNYFSSGFNYARSIVNSIISGIQSIIQRVLSTALNVINGVRNIFSGGFNFMRSVAQGAINGVVGAINGISNAVSNAISWVRNLFNMGGMPGWLSKVLGMGATGFGFDVNMGHDLTGLQANSGATGPSSLGSLIGARNSRTEVTNINITVNGALDPVAVGKQLRQLMNADAVRNGKISTGGSVWQ
jgi:phage-related protein